MRTFGFLLALAGVAFSALAQTNAPQERNLSLEDCFEIALQHNLDVQIKRFSPEISRFTLKAAYGAYDPAFSVSGEHDYSLSAGGVDPQGRTFSGNETESDSFRTGLQGLLPWGLNYNVGGSLSDIYGTRPTTKQGPIVIGQKTNTFEIVGTTNIGQIITPIYNQVQARDPFEQTSGSMGLLQLRQPLLKNFWIDSTRLQIFLDKKNLKISELDVRNQVIQTVTEVETAYYNLIFAQENVKVQQKALELAERLLAENRKRVEVGALAPLDEKQAESQAASSRADLLAAQGTEDTQQRVLKNLLSDDYSKWAHTTIRPTLKLVAVPETFSLQESWNNGLALRPDLLQQRLNLEKQNYTVKFQRNQLLPQVDLIGTYGYNAGSKEFSGALDQFGRGDFPFWSYGAQMTIPLTRTGARNSYKAAQATREQFTLQLKQLEQLVMIQIENAIATSQTSFQRVNATREARTYAEEALSAEEKKLASGKSTSFEVLRLQRDLTSARGSEIRALADYNIALAQVALNEGTTLERRKVSLEVK